MQRVTIGYGAAAPATEMPTDQGKCAVAVYDYQAGALPVTKIFPKSSICEKHYMRVSIVVYGTPVHVCVLLCSQFFFQLMMTN